MRFGELDDERPLRGRIERVTGHRRQLAGNRGDIDDASPAPRDHPGQQTVRQLRQRRHYHLHHGVLMRPGGRRLRARDAASRRCSPARRSSRRWRQLGDVRAGVARSARSEAITEGGHTMPGREIACQRVQAIGPPRRQHQVVAAPPAVRRTPFNPCRRPRCEGRHGPIPLLPRSFFRPARGGRQRCHSRGEAAPPCSFVRGGASLV